MTLTDIFRFLITGEIKTDTEKLLSAAGNGDTDAQVKLGIRYYTGRGVPQSEEEALKWFYSAAGQGNAQAQFYMGRARFSGEGIRKEHESAYAWFHVSAANGYRKADEWLAMVSREMTPEQIEEGRRLAQELAEWRGGSQHRQNQKT